MKRNNVLIVEEEKSGERCPACVGNSVKTASM